MKYAVIDVGSNSIRLCVYEYAGGVLTILLNRREIVSLAGYVSDGYIEMEGISKAAAAVSEFMATAVRETASPEKVFVFATAAMRGILNQAEALELFQKESGVLPEMLSGSEEARLDYIGAAHNLDCTDCLIVDVGGASTEFIAVRDSVAESFCSIPAGCLNLFVQHVQGALPSKDERKVMRRHLEALFEKLPIEVRGDFPELICIGGTARAALRLAKSIYSLPEEDIYLSQKHFMGVYNALKNKENGIFRLVQKLIPDRTLTILPGLEILRQIVREFGVEQIAVSSFGVREGYLFERVLNPDAASG